MKNKLLKKMSSLLLTSAMTLSMFSTLTTHVHAAELPDSTKFATVEELKNFDTNNGTENKAAKVYFGNNNQQWWIAGSQQEQGLTLYAASPLATGVQFNSTRRNGTYEEKTVLANHYGASGIKNTVKDLETSYFTDTEQGLMNVTTIYTNDTIDNSVYSTTNKLYLANGGFATHHITVGTNGENSLNDGLRIDMNYWGNVGEYIWLRTPFHNNIGKALIADPDFLVRDGWVDYELDLKPAFELNLSSVIFASAAPAAISEGTLVMNDAFTLRYKADNLGSVLVSYDKSKVILNDVLNDTYLVVQNSEGAKAKPITSETEVSATDMGLDSFANCKVWLETTNSNERMTYATLATEEQGYDVNITASEGLTVINGVQDVGQGSAITDITVKVNDGYYLPDNYTNTIEGLNGLIVKDVTQYGFTIFGTPTSEVNITLPAATVLPKADTPIVELKTTSTSITATVTNHKTEFGNIEYKWNDGDWEKDKNILSDLKPETTYQLAVRFTGNGFYQMSEVYSVDVTTLKDGNTMIEVPTGLTTTYKEGLKLSDVDLSNTGWTWENGDTSLSAGTKSYPATFDTTSLESTTDFSGVEGYDASTHKVTRVIEVKVDKSVNAWTEELSIKGWTYNDKENDPTAKAQFGDVTFTYSSEENGTYTNKVPKNAGTWYVKATVAGTENYTGLESVVSFEIAKATPTPETLTGLTLGRGQALSKIKLPKQFKWVDETMTADELGTHTFKAIYTPNDTANYQTIEVEIEVEVVPTPVELNHVPTISASDKTIAVGDKFDVLKNVTASDKEDGDLTKSIKVVLNKVDTTKAGAYLVTYEVSDSQGATTAKTITVTVKRKVVEEDKKEETDKDQGTNTGLSLGTGLFAGLATSAASGIGILEVLKRKNRK